MGGWLSQLKYNYYRHNAYHSEYKGIASITVVGSSERFMPWKQADKLAQEIAEQLHVIIGDRRKMISFVPGSPSTAKCYNYQITSAHEMCGGCIDRDEYNLPLMVFMYRGHGWN